MKEIAPLLEKLAEKLGVTVEYLWKVLLKQAFISFVTDLIQYALLVIMSVIVWKIAKKVHREIENAVWDEIAYLPLGGVIMGILILWIMVFSCIPTTITALINPEYWALDKILSQIKK